MGWSKWLTVGLLALLLAGMDEVGAQVGPDTYLVRFSDKENSPYSISDPGAYLSTRAILRRYRAGIPIGEDDLPVNPAYVDALRDLGDLRVLARLKWFNAVLIETSDSAVVAAIADIPFVDKVEARTPAKLIDFPDDHVGFSPKSDGEEYGGARTQIAMLNGLELHEEGFRGAGMVIAVLDAGFRDVEEAPAFARLYEEGRVWATKNFVDTSLDVYRDHFHGSYVLSTMAAYMPDTMIGTAPDAAYVLCLTEDVSQERRVEGVWWAAAVEYADSMGADVVNSSLGYSLFDVADENYSYEDMDGHTTLITRAANRAAEKGMLVVNSAGNSGNQPWYYITAPADGDGVLAVGAVTADSMAGNFSSRGPRADGVVKPDVMALGVGAAFANMRGEVLTGNGTSFASPIIAGMAASLWQSVPEATAMEVKNAIVRSAHLYHAPNDSMGYGIPDFALARQLLVAEAGSAGELAQGRLVIYPNPYADGFLHLRVNGSCGSEAEMELYDTGGKSVYSARIPLFDGEWRGEQALRVAPGAYVMRLRCPSGQVYRTTLIRSSRR